MMAVDLIVDPHSVNLYLAKHGLETGSYLVDAILAQYKGTDQGATAFMLVAVDSETGKRMLVKTTLHIIEVAAKVMRETEKSLIPIVLS